MALTPDERKRKLGFGGLQRIAKRTKRTLGHVSQVNGEKRPDDRVVRAITRELVRLHPELTVGDIWPADFWSQAS